jgi:predicted ATPase/serine phosphatase RsbU (regulator of sigma subunit)/tRNA A-37 threonylcarbamoyl transferase component Bud32
MLTLPNYQIGTQIYESANSVVYRGVRFDDNQPVILKVLKEDYPTPEELTRYRQEYEITKNLTFDGVVKTYGIEKYQNTLVIILEDFGGESLKNLLKTFQFRFEKEELEGISQFLHLVIQVADTLGQIHAANIIHKDINPANIVLNQQTGQVKIIDFGISSRLPRENPVLKNPSQLEGTLAYISPEQTGRMNRSLDYRTDLYSLGVTFYELLTSQLPFSAKDTLELVHCHIAKPPTTVHELNPNISPTLSEIVMKLMDKNADERYQSAFGLKADLEKVRENLPGFQNLAGLSFELAQHDFSGRFQIPQKLYGREKEIETLLKAFERVTGPSISATGKSEMILVAGYSGVGKSALVQEVHKPMTEKRGYFAAGKFDQYQRNIPYSALTQAFNGFCDYLLTESTEQLSKWREKILTAAGPNGQVLLDVIPSLELIIGKQPAVAQVGSTEAQNRFNLVFQNFVKAISQPEHPLVLFIDDLQWADSASLNVLKTLLTDTESRYLLIIGAYRDNEVDGAHPLMLLVQELQKAQAIVNTLVLPNLSKEDVLTLIAETLNSDLEHVQTLTDLVYEKTQGNAFFTHEFLKSLYEQALLIFEVKTQQWQWDFEKIKALEITDNVVELMAGKIGKLVPQAQAALKLAACIGNKFDLKTLSIIYQQAISTTLEHLSPAMTELLIFPLDNRYLDEASVESAKFKFQHDRVQQAAYSLIDTADKQATHLAIGRLLLANTKADDLEEHRFDIVNQFNEGISLVTEKTEKVKLVELNLKAGTKAKAATAYQPAFDYLQIGLGLLSENAWDSYYELILNLHNETAETAYLTGHFEKAQQLSENVLQNAKNVLDKIKVYEIQIQFYAAQNKHPEAVELGLQVVELLGISLRQSPPADVKIEELYLLPEMTNPNHLAGLRILIKLTPSVFLAKPELFPSLVFTMTELCIAYGNSSLATFAYSTYGLLLCAGMSQMELGYQFGKLALNLLEQFKANEIKCQVDYVFNVFIRHWKIHARDTIEALRDNIQFSLEVGDIAYACYVAFNYCHNLLLTGESLGTIQPLMLQYVNFVAKFEQRFQLSSIQIWGQFVFNLRGLNENKRRLMGELFNEVDRLPQLQEEKNLTSLFYFYLLKMILSYLFKDNTNAIDFALQAGNYEQAAAGLMPVTQYPFYFSLSLLGGYPTATQEVQASYLEKVAINQQRMKLWASHAPMNFQHKYDLVEAEKARVLGQNWEAAEFYEKAITGARDNQYLQEEALAYELAAEFYLGRGMEKIAQIYMRDAHYAYQRWGATAKVKQLEDQYPQWLGKTTTKNRFTETQTTITHSTLISQTIEPTVTLTPATLLAEKSSLDLSTVMKASQAISREIRLDHLIKTFMQIVIENVGAEHGCLIMKGDQQKRKEETSLADELFLEAYATLSHVEILDAMPLNEVTAETETGQCFSPAIITYTARKEVPQVLNDARHEGLFINDPHIVQRQPQSVLCFPILYKNELSGLFYLENNQTTGAFTSDRLAVLRMLSSQIAISLENAQYANHLEEKVKQRTAQLATANEEITALNEMLKEENLRMSAELDVAKQLQQMVLPKETELEQIEGLDIAGFMEPADEVGGDYYDVLVEDGRVKIGIGDVTGHGLESGVLMIMVQMGVQTLLTNEVTDPEAFLTVLNWAIYKNVQRIETDKNLTLSLLDYQDGTLRVTGQHEDILIVRQNGEVERIDTFDLGFSVGLKADITPLVGQIELSLQPGDGIVLYTDGITEAQNPQEEQYGMERLSEVVSQNWHLSAKEIQQAVIADVKQYIDTQTVFDDITLLILKQK